MNLRRILTWTAIAFVIFFLFSNPVGASDLVKSVFGLLQSAANSGQTFATNLLS